MRGKLTELKIKIDRELSQCTDITTELKELNLKLESFQDLVSGTRLGVLLLKETRRQIQSTIWLSHSLGEDMIKILDGIKQDIRFKEQENEHQSSTKRHT
jgi:hypothetical protein